MPVRHPASQTQLSVLSVTTKNYRFDDFASGDYALGLRGQVATQLMVMYRAATEKERPVILELGAGSGQSATAFLQACEEKEGRLVSVDINDCSDISDSPRWTFIRSDSTDVEFIVKNAPHLKSGIDVLYIDSLHTRQHVEKELTSWYSLMKEKSWIFFDDVDAQPYRRGNRKDSYEREFERDAIREYVEAFFYANEGSTYLSILYGSTGLASLHKLSPMGTAPNPPSRIVRRGRSFLNDLTHYLRAVPKVIGRRS